MSQCEASSIGALLVNHVAAIRRIPAFRQALAVVIVESNTHYVAAGIFSHCQLPENSTILPAVFLREDLMAGGNGVRRLGARTTPQNKPEMVALIRNGLEENKLHVHEPLVAEGEDHPLYTNVLDYFTQQLESFMEYRKATSSDPDAPVRSTFSGKQGGGKDDLVLALGLNLYWSYKYESDGEMRSRSTGSTSRRR